MGVYITDRGFLFPVSTVGKRLQTAEADSAKARKRNSVTTQRSKALWCTGTEVLGRNDAREQRLNSNEA